MTSPKPVEKLSNPHYKSPSRPTSGLVPRPPMQDSFPTSQRTDADTLVPSREVGIRHKSVPEDLFPEMLAAFEHVQEIVEREHKDPGHDAGQPLSKIAINNVNQGSVFLRRGDEQKIITSLSEERRHKKRKAHEEPQTDVFHTYTNGWIGKRAPSSILPFSIKALPPTRKLSHPTPSPSTTWQTQTLNPTHPSLASRKSLGGPLIEGSDIGTVPASGAFLKGYFEGQAKDPQQGIRWRALGYRQSLV